MKLFLGASGIFYLLVAAVFIAFFILFPYPHYSTETSSWYMGASIGQRLTGAQEDGVALEKVFEKVTKASVTSPLTINCTTNADCKVYTVPNQCMVYCGSLTTANEASIVQLNNNRVCDPATWRRPMTNCVCIHGNCVDLE